MMKDMTEGKPSHILISFAAPMILSGMFQQCYNIIDSVVAGKFAGVDALAAVGASYPISMLFIAVAMGSGIGSSVVVSQIFGAKRFGEMKTAVTTAVISCCVLAIALMAIGFILCQPLMLLLRTPKNIFADSLTYLNIYMAGMVFLFLYNICNAIFNGLVDSKTSLYFLIFSSILNIILDIIFVKDFHWGVAGVAWATFIAQGLSSILAAVALYFRIKKIKTDEEHRIFHLGMLQTMSKIAVPSIIQQSIISVGQLFVQGLVNSFGSIFIAGYAAAIKIDSFFRITIQTMSNAVSNFTAQNAGAGKFDRIKEGYRISVVMLSIYSVVSFLIILVFGSPLIGMFVDGQASEEVISAGVRYMKVVSLFYIVFSIMLSGNGVLRGTGRMRSFMASTLTDLAVRVGVAYSLSIVLGEASIWYAVAIGWTIGMIITTYYYRKGDWKYNLLQKREG